MMENFCFSFKDNEIFPKQYAAPYRGKALSGDLTRKMHLKKKVAGMCEKKSLSVMLGKSVCLRTPPL
jgi:hypothetical protein